MMPTEAQNRVFWLHELLKDAPQRLSMPPGVWYWVCGRNRSRRLDRRRV
jgi:hypothetical protein